MTDPRTFDLFADDEQIEYATDTVDVVRNRQALYDAIMLEKKLDKPKALDKAEVEALEKKLTELREQVRASTYVITLRGISVEKADGLAQSVKDERFPDVPDDNPDLIAAKNTVVLEAMLVSIVDAEGRSATLPTGDMVYKWYMGLPEEAKGDIMDKLVVLTYSAMKLDMEVNNADF